jgi:ABC-type branched-subunit amino acid transport system substrate-binding protein
MVREGMERMVNNKRWSAFLAILAAFLLVFTSCASTNSSEGPNTLQAGPGVDLATKTITLGLLSPSSGLAAASVGIPVTNGVKAYFDHVNDQGGIDGFRVKFLAEDTRYDPQIEVQAYNQIHNQVLMIADSVGTPTTFAIKDLAAADHMLVSAVTLSSALARQKYLILVGTPYRLHVENAFDYVVNRLGVKNLATGIIFEDDEYGQDGLTGYQEAVKVYHLHDMADISYEVTSTNFTTQVAQLKASGAKYVFLQTLPTATASIIATAYKLGYFPQWILQGTAFATELLTIPGLKSLLSRAWTVSQGATWGDRSVPGMVQMLQDVAKYYPQQQPNGYFEVGYVESEVTYAILKKALDNGDLTRDGLFRAFESLKAVNLGGLYPSVTYGSTPNERVPTRDSVLYQIDTTYPTDRRPMTSDFTGTAARQSQF